MALSSLSHPSCSRRSVPGRAGAGPALLAAVLNPEESVALWVADPNPRAQAFYRKHGFVPRRDGPGRGRGA
jgi:hypothetical protein